MTKRETPRNMTKMDDFPSPPPGSVVRPPWLLKKPVFTVDQYGRIAGLDDPIYVPDDAGVHFICDLLNSVMDDVEKWRQP